jgi:hypothetical protein
MKWNIVLKIYEQRSQKFSKFVHDDFTFFIGLPANLLNVLYYRYKYIVAKIDTADIYITFLVFFFVIQNGSEVS